jgi:hypothetical protein
LDLLQFLLPSNHISSVALEFNIPAGDKDGNGCSRQKLMLTLQLCKIQINFACIKQNNIGYCILNLVEESAQYTEQIFFCFNFVRGLI